MADGGRGGPAHPLLGVLANAGRGLAMGAAEVVPGVSGGTIALVVGIYERLVASIGELAGAAGRLARRDVASARAALGRVEWHLVLPLATGIVAAVLAGAQLLPPLLDRHREEVLAVFFGLVAASLVVPWRMMRRRRPIHVLTAAPAAVAAFLIAGASEQGGGSEPALPFVALGASIAVVALVLPGVSGSFLLLLMGLYEPSLAALDDRDLVYVAVFIAGALVGLGVFARLLRWLLREHRDPTLAVLIGFIAGALRGVWPYADDGAVQAPPLDGTGLAHLGLAAGGVALVATLALISRRAPDA